jgi:uncharacterized protein (DUF1015 family)
MNGGKKMALNIKSISFEDLETANRFDARYFFLQDTIEKFAKNANFQLVDLGTKIYIYRKEFLEKIKIFFDVTCEGESQVSPSKKAEIGMYLDGNWYRLNAKTDKMILDNPVNQLDVAILQDYLLSPILGIEDPRSDKRIDFAGGIRGLEYLEQRCHTDMKMAISMYPTSLDDLMSVADAGDVMPPKSTWFEPKLRSGILIHKI